MQKSGIMYNDISYHMYKCWTEYAKHAINRAMQVFAPDVYQLGNVSQPVLNEGKINQMWRAPILPR